MQSQPFQNSGNDLEDKPFELLLMSLPKCRLLHSLEISKFSIKPAIYLYVYLHILYQQVIYAFRSWRNACQADSLQI